MRNKENNLEKITTISRVQEVRIKAGKIVEVMERERRLIREEKESKAKLQQHRKDREQARKKQIEG